MQCFLVKRLKVWDVMLMRRPYACWLINRTVFNRALFSLSLKVILVTISEITACLHSSLKSCLIVYVILKVLTILKIFHFLIYIDLLTDLTYFYQNIYQLAKWFNMFVKFFLVEWIYTHTLLEIYRSENACYMHPKNVCL